MILVVTAGQCIQWCRSDRIPLCLVFFRELQLNGQTSHLLINVVSMCLFRSTFAPFRHRVLLRACVRTWMSLQITAPPLMSLRPRVMGSECKPVK